MAVLLLLLLLLLLLQGQGPCLFELRLSIPSGCITAVVGEVGAGEATEV
jgi:ABC-type methionine transport system ATPase subunit